MIPRVDRPGAGDLVREESLGGLLREAALLEPHARALTHRDAWFTYAQLWMTIEQAAKGLLAAGIVPGDRILTWSSAVPETVTIQCAAALCGAIVVRLAEDLDDEAALAALTTTMPRRVFVQASFEGRQYPAVLRALRDAHGLSTEIVVHGRQARFERVLPGGWLDFLDAGAGTSDAALRSRLAEAGDARPVAICFAKNIGPVEITKPELLEAALRWRAAPPSGRPVLSGANPSELVIAAFSGLLSGNALGVGLSGVQAGGRALPSGSRRALDLPSATRHADRDER